MIVLVHETLIVEGARAQCTIVWEAAADPSSSASYDVPWVTQVIAEAILSISPEESDQTFAHMYLPIVTEGNLRTWYPYRSWLPTPANFAFQRNVKTLNDYIASLIVKR